MAKQLRAADLKVGASYKLQGLAYNNGKIVTLVKMHSPSKHYHAVRFVDPKVKPSGAGLVYEDGSFVVLARNLSAI